jgi:hypothetical protein
MFERHADCEYDLIRSNWLSWPSVGRGRPATHAIGQDRMTTTASPDSRSWPGDNPLYHQLRREFTVTEGSVPGTRGSLGSECGDPRGFMAEFGG